VRKAHEVDHRILGRVGQHIAQFPAQRIAHFAVRHRRGGQRKGVVLVGAEHQGDGRVAQNAAGRQMGDRDLLALAPQVDRLQFFDAAARIAVQSNARGDQSGRRAVHADLFRRAPTASQCTPGQHTQPVRLQHSAAPHRWRGTRQWSLFPHAREPAGIPMTGKDPRKDRQNAAEKGLNFSGRLAGLLR